MLRSGTGGIATGAAAASGATVGSSASGFFGTRKLSSVWLERFMTFEIREILFYLLNQISPPKGDGKNKDPPKGMLF